MTYTQDFSVAAGKTGVRIVFCPDGWRAFAGGVGATTTNPPAHQIQMTVGVGSDGSVPDPFAAVQGWKASIYNYGSASETFRVYALCSKNSDAVVGPTQGFEGPQANPLVIGVGCVHKELDAGHLTGGGITNTTGSLSPPPDYVTSSGPTDNGNTWESGVFQFATDTRGYEMVPVCSKTVDSTFVQATSPLPAKGTASKSVACPDGMRVIGGGARISNDGFGKAIDDSAPTGKGGVVPNAPEPAYGWMASAANVTDSAETLTVSAFCVTDAAAPPGATTPALSGAHLAPTSYRAAKSGSSTSTSSGTGTTVRYQDSVAATTTITVLKTTKGHLRSGKCLAGGVGKICTRTVARGSFVHDDTAGANHVHFSGRIAGHTLAPGTYVLALTPHANGHAGATIRLGFRIVA